MPLHSLQKKGERQDAPEKYQEEPRYEVNIKYIQVEKKRILPKFQIYYENLQDLESGIKKKGNTLTPFDKNCRVVGIINKI